MKYLRCLFCFLIFGDCLAATYQLFESPRRPHSQYNDFVKKITKGDVVIFSNGRKFKITEVLGPKGVSLILKTDANKVLRIPIEIGFFRSPFNSNSVSYQEFIDMFGRGYPLLQQEGVVMVKQYDWQSREYVEVEYVSVQFTLDQFLEGKIPVDLATRAKILGRLYQWMRGTWNLTYIADFNESQVAYDGERWVLLDFAEGVHTVQSFMQLNGLKEIPRETIFDRDDNLYTTEPSVVFSAKQIERIYRNFSRVIYRERLKRFSVCSRFLMP